MEEDNQPTEQKLEVAIVGQRETVADAETEQAPAPGGEDEEVIDVGGVKEVFDEEGYVAAQDQTLYCVCRQRYVDGVYMVECTECKEWYHPECLNQWPRAHEVLQKYTKNPADPLPTFTTEQLDKEPAFFCPKCIVRDRYRHYNFPTLKPKKCAWQLCKKPVGPNSKYCSRGCGLMQAAALAHVLTRRAKDLDTTKTKRSEPGIAVNMTPHKDDDVALSRLAAIKERLQNVQRDLQALTAQNRYLDLAVQKAEDLGRSATEPSSTTSKGGGEMDCMVCGQPVLPRAFARHIRQCGGKVEELHVPTAVHHIRPYSHPSLLNLQCGQLCRRTGQKEQIVCRRLKESCPLHAVDKKKLNRGGQLCGYPQIANSTEWPVPSDWQDESDWPTCSNWDCGWHRGWALTWKARIAQETFVLKAEEADLQLQERDIYLELGRVHNPYNRFFGSTEDEIQLRNASTDVER
eukprot:comp16244_c0_seq1/m.13956 comp16244_c0_seq1/g.13956  ORF comp16244_c0_seq1/g.13956 comp16244_c0_seq1/m.13956 type:complete len:461 (-) comp16244_c0_seq1:19-1401(-)